jgi:hypothetical protein
MPDERREPRAEWDGIERRTKPHEYELRSIIREELTTIERQQIEMRQAQINIERKVTEWELAAKWFRIFVVATVAGASVLVGIWEWARTHIR